MRNRSAVPPGLSNARAAGPSAEALGYFQLSLRDRKHNGMQSATRFQIHLSTAVVAMIFASVFVGINVTRKDSFTATFRLDDGALVGITRSGDEWGSPLAFYISDPNPPSGTPKNIWRPSALVCDIAVMFVSLIATVVAQEWCIERHKKSSIQT